MAANFCLVWFLGRTHAISLQQAKDKLGKILNEMESMAGQLREDELKASQAVVVDKVPYPCYD